MWETEYAAVPPQRHQGNISICNRYRVVGPLDVTDRDIRSTFHRFVSICNNYELKQLLNVTDQDKTSQRPYHRRLHSSAKSGRRGIPASLIFSTSFPGFLSSSNVNRSTLCPSIVR